MQGQHTFGRWAVLFIVLGTLSTYPTTVFAEDSPAPLLEKGPPVDWWFASKLNTASFPACRGGAARACILGGDVQEYR